MATVKYIYMVIRLIYTIVVKCLYIQVIIMRHRLFLRLDNTGAWVVWINP